MKRNLFILACAGGLLALTGCRHNMFNFGFGVKGSGVAKSEKRNVGNFRGLNVSGAFQVEVTCQKDASLEITADDNLLKHIKTEVRDGILHIETDGAQLNFKDAPRAVITVPDLEDFNISGASRVKVANMKSGDVKVNLSGASQLVADGTAQSVEADLSGASKLDGKDLQAAKVDVNASGASKADVYASAALKAEASGASTVHYYGSPPNISPKANGASKISAGS